MRSAIFASIFCAFMPSAFGQEGAHTCSIFVSVVNLRNDEGTVAAALYNSEKGFPEDSTAVFRSAHGQPSGGRAAVVFTGIPYGYYAIAVLHDENMNGRMDKGIFGIPKEGYGFSNNVTGFMRAPSFEKAGFMCDRDSVVLTIRMKY